MASYDELLLQSQLQNAGPAAMPLIRRSAYLANALDAIGKSGADIKSGGALASNLLANALLQWGRSKNDKKLHDAEQADRQAMFDAMTTGLQGGQSVPPPPPPPAASPPLASAAPTPSGSPPDWNAVGSQAEMMARLLMGEAGGDDRGQRAVASVVLNRANQSGLSPGQVMTAPHQFEPLNNPHTRAKLDAIPTTDPRFQQALANETSVLNNGPTTNADHFWSPQAQAALGRQPPAWASPGQNIGGNVFTHNGYSAPPGMSPPQPPPPEMASAAPPGEGPAVPPLPSQPPQPFQVASNGPIPVPGGGAGGGGPPGAPAAAPPPQPSYTPPPTGLGETPQEKAQIAALWSSGRPALQQQALQMLTALRRRVTEPEKPPEGYRWDPAKGAYARQVPDSKQVTINGVTYFVDPDNPSHMTPVPIPLDAMNRNLTPDQAVGAGYASGSIVSRSPLGVDDVKQAPPPNYRGNPNTGYRPIQGSSADPAAWQNRNTPIPPGSDLPPGTRGTLDASGKPTIVYSPSDTAQSKAGYTYRAYIANEALNDMARRGLYKPSTNQFWINFAGGNIQQALMSPEDRQLYSTYQAFVAPFLRKESGAVISPQEEAGAIRTFLPLPTDDPGTLWLKAQRRGELLHSMMNESGPVFKDTYGAPEIHALTDPSGQPQPAQGGAGGAPPPPTQRLPAGAPPDAQMLNGKVYVRRDGQLFEWRP